MICQMVVYAGCRRCSVCRAASGVLCAYSKVVVDVVKGLGLMQVAITIRLADTINSK